MDDLQATNDHLRASLLHLQREIAALLGLAINTELPEFEDVSQR